MKNRVLENEKVIQCVYFVIHCISVCYDDTFFLYEKRSDHRRETETFLVGVSDRSSTRNELEVYKMLQK